METQEINAAAFDTALRNALNKARADAARTKIAVAVSGGGDSLALALLLNDWARENGGEITALTVDHKLRQGSTAEAQQVQALLRARGIAHEILTWEGEKPCTHIQEAARRARYALLLEYCRAHGFPLLAAAHNLEDQAETFWMRLAHGSGLDGLAGMQTAREMDGVTLIRPLLGFSRAALRRTCEAFNIQWLEDPSNENEKFLRVRLRAFESLLADEGLTPQRLAQTMQKLEEAKEALQSVTAEAFAGCVCLQDEGYAELDVEQWAATPRDIQRRVLATALAAVAPQTYPPESDALEALRLELHKAGFAGKTLAGCDIFPQKNKIFFAREENVVEGRIPARTGHIWDNRFMICGVANADVTIGAVGETIPAPSPLPFKVKRVLPGLWKENTLLAVPHLGYYSEACPEALKKIKLNYLAAA
jgi:tRNA(Ile)-lysidine synthase